MSRIIKGQKWYYRLIHQSEGRGLMDDFPLSVLESSLIVSWTVDTRGPSTADLGSDTTIRLFSRFPSYLEFFTYQQQFTPSQHGFYEIILGEYRQKPHFDLDIPNSDSVVADAICNRLIDTIENHLMTYGISWNPNYDCMIYSSHQPDGKHSYHLIVNNYCHRGADEAKIFYLAIIQLLPESDRQYIDHAVYGTRQNFRILGSTKFGANRPKIFCSNWTRTDGSVISHSYYEPPESPNHQHLIDLEESLISVVHSCFPIPIEIPEPERHPSGPGFELPPDLAPVALQVLRSHLTTGAFPYKFRGIRGSLILLKRLVPSNCKICNRIHQNENPYLRVTPIKDNPGTYWVYFYCHRAPGKSWYVGNFIDPTNRKIEPGPAPQSVEVNWQNTILESLRMQSKSSSGIQWTAN